MNQLDLFGDTTAPAQYAHNPLPPQPLPEKGEARVSVKDEKKRYGNQCETILAKLREGSVTNHELSDISLKYTSRISDLRKAGHVIECVVRSGGLRIYRIKEEG